MSARTHSYGNAFIGRDDALRELARSLESAQALTTLVGPPGVGKTRLLDEWAMARPERATHRISLVSLSTREEITHALSRAPLGARLLLDNAEHLARSLAEAWTEWRRESPGARAVATSRLRLGVDDELVVPLAPLRAEAALTLWRTRLRERTGRDAPWRAEDARLLGRLHGLPLAIEVVVSSLSTYSVEDLLRHFELVMHATTPDATSDEPRSLVGALATSWDLLSAGDRRALVCASLTAGGFDDAFAAEVFATDAVGARGHRESLVEQSLLTRNGERLDVLEAVRAFALGVADPATTDGAKRAFVEHYAERFRVGTDDGSSGAIERIRRERGNGLRALAYAMERGEPERAAPIVRRLSNPRVVDGMPRAVIESTQRWLNAVPHHTSLAVWGPEALAECYRRAGEVALALASAARMRALAVALDDVDAVLRADLRAATLRAECGLLEDTGETLSALADSWTGAERGALRRRRARTSATSASRAVTTRSLWPASRGRRPWRPRPSRGCSRRSASRSRSPSSVAMRRRARSSRRRRPTTRPPPRSSRAV